MYYPRPWTQCKTWLRHETTRGKGRADNTTDGARSTIRPSLRLDNWVGSITYMYSQSSSTKWVTETRPGVTKSYSLLSRIVTHITSRDTYNCLSKEIGIGKGM